MRIFYLEHQKMHYQMDRDTVLVLLRGQSVFGNYTPEQLTLAPHHRRVKKQAVSIYDVPDGH